MNRPLLFALVAFFAATSLEAGMWKNLNDSAWQAGPKITEADLAGKVVLVDQWGVDCTSCKALLPRLQKLWDDNKAKPFVLVGCHCQGRQPEKMAKIVEANHLTYPIYQGFGLAKGEPSSKGIPYLYLVDHTGKLVYAGYDEDRAIKEAKLAADRAAAEMTSFSLVGGIFPKVYKTQVKSLVLGKNVNSILKKLQSEVKRAESKNANPKQKEAADEAKLILDAVEQSKEYYRHQIDAAVAENPPLAYKIAKAYVVTFPVEGTDLKAKLSEMATAAKNYKPETKAAPKSGPRSAPPKRK